VGIFGLPDIYEQPRNSLDLVGSQTVGMFRFKMALENILDDDVVFEQEQPEVPGVAEEGSKVTHTSHIGRSLSLSVGLQL
ncbi:MAG TPA: hypothetical protein VNM87_12870, partial [Candidatus Udaeobacter sp.]|nr:hypothetical protein [Candidatus Udaeobacter sp.]